MSPRQPYPWQSIVLVRLDPVVGSEQGKVSPRIVTTDAETVGATVSSRIYAVVPLTHSQTLTGPLAPRIKARPDEVLGQYLDITGVSGWGA